jgi:WD40 repeat protein
MHLNFPSILRHRELNGQIPNHFQDEHIIQNMAKKIYSKTNFKHDKDVIAVDVHNYFTVTLTSDNSLALWNLETGKCRWKFNPEHPENYQEIRKIVKGMIKIIEDKIFYFGLAKFSVYNDNTLRIIDLKTGLKTAEIKGSKLEENKICIIGKRIFGVFNEEKIKEWDLDGKLIQLIDSEQIPTGLINKCLGLDNFLVHTRGNTIIIYHLQTGKGKKIQLEKLKGEEVDILDINIDSRYLICGYTKYEERNISHCCSIDLGSKSIVKQYQLVNEWKYNKCFIGDPEEHMYSYIWKIIIDKEWAYLGYSSGLVIALNLAEKTHIVLGKHVASINYLVLNRQILISGSKASSSTLAELKFWNIKAMKEIAKTESVVDLNKDSFFKEKVLITKMKLLDLLNVSHVTGKVLTSVNNSLIQWDYLDAHDHENKKIEENNAFEIHENSYGGGCCLM